MAAQQLIDYAAQHSIVRGSTRCTKERYRSRASTAHPDKGGSTAEMAELNQAREDALKECT